MRNLKRTLSLVLAAAMLVGMMVVSASAASKDFSDSAEIKNTEAVDVMVALGVLEGTNKGDFNPTGILTREQAAKIICYMMMGPANAEKLSNNSTIFSDVAANRWSAPFIAYCANLGILAGTGNGKFNPEGELTGLTFGKMLLVALGYDAKIEGYVGKDWATNVAVDMVSAGIDVKGITLSDPLSRDNAAQMAFQTLTADMVYYTNKGTEVTTSDGTSIVIGASDAAKVANSQTNDYRTTNRDTIQQFCEKYFDKLTARNSGTDAMGRPAEEWLYKNSSIGVYSETPDYTAYVTAKNNTTMKVIDAISKKFTDTNATVTVNGVASTLGAAVSIGDYVEVYMDANDAEDVDIIAITHKSVAELTGDAATKASDGDTLVRVPGVTGLNTYNSANTTETVHGYADLKDGDVVLYYADSEGEYYLEKAESFDGTLTAVSSGKLTVSGTKYDQSGVTNAFSGITINNFYSDVSTWYTDNDGNLVWVKGEESTELAYVVKVRTDSVSSWGTTNYAMLLHMDGTIETVETKTLGTEDTFVKYSVKDGKYVLTTVGVPSSGVAGATATANNNSFATTKGNPTITINSANVLTNANTVFLIRDYDSSTSASKDAYSLYTGYAKVPTIASTQVTTGGSGNGKSAVAYIGTNGYAQYVIIDTVSNVSGTTTASDMFFVVSNTVTTLYDADGVKGYSVRAIKNGGDAIVDLEFETSPSVATGSAYVATSYNDDGQIASFGSALTTGNEYIVGSDGTGKANNGTFKLGTAAFAYTDDTKVYYIDKNNELSVMSVADLDDDANDSYVAIRGSKTSTDANYNTITALFVKQNVTNVTIGSIGNVIGSASAVTGAAQSYSVSVSGQAGTATVSYAWTVNGTPVGSNSNTLSYTYAAAGNYTVGCTVTVTDLTVDGTTTASQAAASLSVNVTAAP